MKFNYLFIGLAVVLLMQCSGNENISLRLTNRERVRIDTLYTQKLDSLRPIWDNICDEQYPIVLEKAVDSIVRERLEEEEELRNRALKNSIEF